MLDWQKCFIFLSYRVKTSLGESVEKYETFIFLHAVIQFCREICNVVIFKRNISLR